MPPRPSRKPPNRTASATIYVRCLPAEKAVLAAAAAKLTADIAGAKLPVHTYILQAGLEKAKAAGFTVPGAADEKKGKGGGR